MEGLIGTIVVSLFAAGCFLLVVGMMQSAGKPVRRAGLTLIAIPLAGSFFFGALKETLHQQPIDGISINAPTILVLIVISVVAYIALQIRRASVQKDQRFQIREKRPIDPAKRGVDIVSMIRDQLRRDDD